MAAVADTAAPNTSSRSQVNDAPSEKAVSSRRERMFKRQRMSSITASPASASGSTRSNSGQVTPDRSPSSQKTISGNWLSGSAMYCMRPRPDEKSAETAMSAKTSRSVQSPA